MALSHNIYWPESEEESGAPIDRRLEEPGLPRGPYYGPHLPTLEHTSPHSILGMAGPVLPRFRNRFLPSHAPSSVGHPGPSPPPTWNQHEYTSAMSEPQAAEGRFPSPRQITVD